MKKILLVVVFCSVNFALAEDTENSVYLDLNYGEKHEYNFSAPKVEKINIKEKDDFDEDYIYHPMKYIKEEAKELYGDKLFFNKNK